MNLSELIAAHKSGRSYEELARDCGNALTSQRLQQIATTAPKAFPSADTIRGLARGLRVPESVVVLAVAESLGLDVSRAIPRLVELLPASALRITDRQAAAVAEVIRSFIEVEPSEVRGLVELHTGSGKTASLVRLHRDEIATAVDSEIKRLGGEVPERLVRIAVETALDSTQHPELYEDIAARGSTE